MKAPASSVPVQAPPPLSENEERTWAMLAHLSILLNLISGGIGLLLALVIYLLFQNRSRYVAYHGLQSFFFQLVFWIGGGLLTAIAWTVSGLLSVVLIGLCLMPFALLVTLIPAAAVIYGIVGGVQCSQGQDFRYWLVGDWMRGTLGIESA